VVTLTYSARNLEKGARLSKKPKNGILQAGRGLANIFGKAEWFVYKP
jgi:hypothetical protein